MVTTKKKNRLSDFFAALNCEDLAFIVLALLALQPLFGLAEAVATREDLVALFYGKASVIRFLGWIGLAVGILDSWQKSTRYGIRYLKGKLGGNPWNLLFLLILVWALISGAAAVDPEKAFLSYAYRYEGIFSYLGYAGFFMCGSLIRDDVKRRRLIDLLIIVSVILACATLISEQQKSTEAMHAAQYAAENPDAAGDYNERTLLERGGWVGNYSGTFINSNHYGYFFCVVLMLCAGRYAIADWKGKLLFGGAFALNLYVLMFNDTFGPYLALTVGLVVYGIILTVRMGWKKTAWYLVILVIFFGMGGLVRNGTMLKTYGSIFRELVDVLKAMIGASDAGQTVEEALRESQAEAGSGRMRIWLAAIDVFKQHPFIGCGPENVPFEMEATLGGLEATHNEYIQVLAEMGIIGFLLYFGGHVWFFVRNIKRCKVTSDASLIAYGAAATYLISAAFGITITVSEVFFFFVLGLANGSHTSEVLDGLEQ